LIKPLKVSDSVYNIIYNGRMGEKTEPSLTHAASKLFFILFIFEKDRSPLQFSPVATGVGGLSLPKQRSKPPPQFKYETL